MMAKKKSESESVGKVVKAFIPEFGATGGLALFAFSPVVGGALGPVAGSAAAAGGAALGIGSAAYGNYLLRKEDEKEAHARKKLKELT